MRHLSFRRASQLALLVVVTSLVTGCALQPAASDGLNAASQLQRHTIDDFALSGRFSLRYADKNYSGRLNWRHQGTHNTVLLASPFGQGMAEIITNNGEARLTTSDGKVFVAADSETLTRDVLGYALPLARLTDWIRARHIDGQPGTTSQLDPLGRPLRLLQDGWRIDYEYGNDDPLALPNLLIAERPGEFELRLRIDEWNRLPAAEDKDVQTP